MIPLIGNGLAAALLGAAMGVASFGIAFAVGMRRAVLAVFLIRSSCDPLFELTKSALGTEMGAGAAINALVIGLALLFFVESPVLVGSAILPWAAFLMSAFTSTIISPEPMMALKAFLSLISYAAVFALPFALIRSREWAVRCLMVVLYSSVIPVAYGFIEFASGTRIMGEDRIGVKSTFTHPNIFAFYLICLFSLILFMLRSRLVLAPLRLKRLLVLYLPIIIVLLLLSGARSAWVAAAIILIVYASSIDKRYLLCLLLVPFMIYVPGVEDRLVDLQSGNEDIGYVQLNSYAWRKLLWQNTWDWMMANPIQFFGYGLASFKHYVPLFHDRATWVPVGAHNTFLQIFFEMGIFGLLAFTWLFVALFTNLKKGFSFDKAGSIIMMTFALSFLVVSYADNMLDYLVVEWYFWFIMGVVCAWNELIYQKHRREDALDSQSESPSARFASARATTHANDAGFPQAR
jgi:O-antigen ligase